MRDVIRSNPEGGNQSIDSSAVPGDDGGIQDAIKDRLTARRNAHSADCNPIAYPIEKIAILCHQMAIRGH
jgi:hypothetical protein